MADETDDIVDTMVRMKGDQQPFAVATVVHASGDTAAREGARAVVRGDGSVVGWIGGGRTLAAVRRTAARALVDGRTRFIRVRPKDGAILDETAGGRTQDFDSACPTGSTVEVFVEPVLPRASLIVVGASEVARALCDIGRRMGFAVTVAAPPGELDDFGGADHRIEGFDPARAIRPASSFVAVATQGMRDRDGLRFALAIGSSYVAFVASAGKAAKLTQELREEGIEADALARIRAPAGLPIGADTPEEIAVSILADVVRERRLGAAQEAASDSSFADPEDLPEDALAEG